MSNDSRKAFEIFMSKERGWDRIGLEKNHDDSYINSLIECAWIGWSANESRHAAELERVKAKGAEHYNAAINLDADLAKCKAEREALVRKLRDMPFVTIEQKSRFRDEVFALLDSGSQG
jgi:hypothetical protein